MRRRVRPYLWVVGCVWLLPALAFTVASAVLPKDVPGGQCEGIALGCVPSPATSVAFVGALAAPVLAVAGLVGLTIVLLVQLADGADRAYGRAASDPHASRPPASRAAAHLSVPQSADDAPRARPRGGGRDVGPWWP